MQEDKGFVLWFTGLSGSGKSTLSLLVADELRRRNRNVEILDGDEVRENLSKGLGFSKEDRDINIRRIGYVCNMLARNGVVAISAAISPYRKVRNEVRGICGEFVEVHADCTIEELTRRDVKGLYKKALSGEIKNFTGISDPYEEPENPEIKIDSGNQAVEESFQQILAYLESRSLIPAAAASARA